jgi:hypothetical protein
VCTECSESVPVPVSSLSDSEATNLLNVTVRENPSNSLADFKPTTNLVTEIGLQALFKSVYST